MEQERFELEPPTAEHHWLLDHHIEELLGMFCDAALLREINPDGVEQAFD